MTKRAVLYARVSGDDRGNDGRNLTGQLDMCREHALKQGWDIVAELAEDDRGASGASFELPQLNRVREMAQAGEFDVLVVREIDRLSRNLAKQLIVEEELKRAGVEIEYALGEYPDTPEGRLNKHIRATIAEFEREKIAERMVRGRQLKAKAGSVMTHGQAPYGYRVVEQDGMWMLVIYEPEARIVRLIFVWYTSGDGQRGPMSHMEIAQKLMEMQVPTPASNDPSKLHGKPRKGRVWQKSTLAKIVRNETYAGVWRYGKFDRSGGQRRKRLVEEQIAVEVPAIIDRALWEDAQARVERNKSTAKRNTKRNYLMRGRGKCGVCGRVIGVHAKTKGEREWLYYRCNSETNSTPKDKPCGAPNFRADHVDAAIWEWVRSFLDDPEELARGLTDYQAKCDQENAPLRQRLQIVEDLLAENQTHLDRLLDLYLSGTFSKEMLTERKTRLESTIQALERERSSLAKHLETQTLTDEQIQCLQDFAAGVARGLKKAQDDFDARRRVIELMDVEMTLVAEGRERVVYARCMLGAKVLSIPPSHTGILRHRVQNAFGLTVRLVIPRISVHAV